jgi:outer membrane protein assembly factor BamB
LTAFAPASGDVIWRWTGAPAYATPVVATLANVRQLVTQSKTHVVGVAVADGRLLWEIPFTTSYDQNAVTPLVIDGMVIYSGLSNGTTAVKVVRNGGAFTTEPLWKNGNVSMYMSSPVAAGNTIIGLSHRNKGQFFALDRTTGRTLWMTEGRQADNAALIRLPGFTLIQTTDGHVVIVRDSRTQFDVVHRYDVADDSTWAHPALVGNRLFVRDADSLTMWVL